MDDEEEGGQTNRRTVLNKKISLGKSLMMQDVISDENNDLIINDDSDYLMDPNKSCLVSETPGNEQSSVIIIKINDQRRF